MSILTGRYGQVGYDPAGLTPVAIISLNAWKMSQKTNYTDVSCFGDANKVYVPGLKDISGSFGGFWNKDDRTLFTAVNATTPGLLKLVPNYNDPTYYWSGLAYMDADIDVGLDVGKVSGSFMAAAAWAMYP